MENGTRQLVEQGSHFFSYMREVELVLNKLYTDLGEILFSIELASMNKLAVFLFPPKKLMYILQSILTHLEQGVDLIAPLKPEFMYVFYEAIQITAVASSHTIRLFLQMPLREEIRTFFVFKILTVPVYNLEIKGYVQLRTPDVMLAVSKDRINFVGLNLDFFKFCMGEHLTFCEFRTPVYDRNYMTCSSALYFGKNEVVNEVCEKIVWGYKIPPIFMLVSKNPATWLYSLHGALTLECDCPNETRQDIELKGAGLLKHPPSCRLRNELLTLSIGRTFNSQYHTKPDAINVPRLFPVNLTKEAQIFQKQEGDISALLSEFQGSPSATTSEEDLEDRLQPHPVHWRQLVEEALNRKEVTRREAHLTWVTGGVILVLTVQLLGVSRALYRCIKGSWRNLVSRLRAETTPPRSGESTQESNPSDAASPGSSGDVRATTTDERGAAIYNAPGQIHVCMVAK